MKTVSSYLKRTIVVIAFSLFSAVGFSAESNDLGQSAGSVAVPPGFSRTQVQTMVEQALLGRKWEVQSKAGDKVVGYLKHRSSEATLTLMLTDKQVDLFCVGWQIEKKTGKREKPEQPTSWLKNIQADLTKLFAKAAGVK